MKKELIIHPEDLVGLQEDKQVGNSGYIRAGRITEERLLKMFETKKWLTGFWVAKTSDMPARTACSGLIRLANNFLI